MDLHFTPFLNILPPKRNVITRFLLNNKWKVLDIQYTLKAIISDNPTVIFYKDRPVGFFIILFNTLSHIEILPDYRNQGICNYIINKYKPEYVLCNKVDDEPWEFWEKRNDIKRLNTFITNKFMEQIKSLSNIEQKIKLLKKFIYYSMKSGDIKEYPNRNVKVDAFIYNFIHNIENCSEDEINFWIKFNYGSFLKMKAMTEFLKELSPDKAKQIINQMIK